jgi:hypothetical protein
MDILDSDPIDGIEADVADVLEQSEPPYSEPVEQALGQRDAVPDVDPELTGIEAEEAEDSGQA